MFDQENQKQKQYSRPKQSALSYSLMLIKIRLRSEHELVKKMTEKNYLEDEIKKVIADLKNVDLINDERFAKMWLLTQNNIRPSGKQYLIFKMKHFGLSKEIIENAFAELDEEFDELILAKKLLESKKRSFMRFEKHKKKEKMLALLIRRGFCYSVAKEVVEEIKDEISNF
jgi:regulatory protein